MTTTPELHPNEFDVLPVIARCIRGDQTGYNDLYDQYAHGLYRLCYSLLLHREDAEDVMQESFVYAFKNLHRFNGQLSSFKTWLYTIAICRCRNHYRRARLPSLDIASLLSREPHAPRSETPEAITALANAREAVEKALRSLNPRLREAVVLRYGHGMTYREIADVMDCPLKTAESRVRLAQESLRGGLGMQGQGLLEEILATHS
jgi:RNA polymerase sigma-70 factor, ECF subfamily